jgi:hypothetical protein
VIGHVTALTSCRDPEAAQETWRVYYSDVLAGSIAQKARR